MQLGILALRQQRGQRGRALAEQEFTLERVIKQTLALYRG
jgi:glycosyltransferase involved in cell wall biosynthesis